MVFKLLHVFCIAFEDYIIFRFIVYLSIFLENNLQSQLFVYVMIVIFNSNQLGAM